MKIIRDTEIVNRVLEQYQIYSFFSEKDLPFFLAEADRGEDLNYQLNPNDYFLFFLRGKIRIRHINEEGIYFQIASIQERSMLGDMEFVNPGAKQYLIEVESNGTLFAVLPLENERERLEKDPVFLLAVAREIEEKMERAGMDVHIKDMLEDRFLYYISMQKNKTITSVQETCDSLHCSRRQLQRILKKLCSEGVLEKAEKGKYRMTCKAPMPEG